MSEREFLLANYERILEAALNSGYEFLSFDQIGKEQGPLSCLLRHDIDSELLHCNQMMDIEKELGIKATYFVMTRSTAYNLFCVEAMKQIERILSDGHRLGLHFMGELCEGDDTEIILEKVLNEVRWLEIEFGAPVNAISFHQPTKNILDSNFEIPSLCNTYNKNQTHPYFYVSDTNMSWLHEHPLDIFLNQIYPRLQLLIHPIWWTETLQGLEAKWKNVLDNNRRSVISHWSERERSLNGINLL